jgi:site-specific DNA recombinase
METPKRSVIYIRVSSQGQEDNASLATQEARCRAYAEERGYAVLALFSDVHTGAQYRERPGLSALREQVRTRSVDVVLAFAVDRLSRNQAHLAILAEEVEDHGARLEFVTEEFEDSAVGRFIRSAKSFAAEVEREKLSERTVRGRIARVQSGKLIPGARPPYGYRWRDETRGQLDVDPITAPVVRRMFGAVASGASLNSVATALMQEGIPTPSGKGIWHSSTISTILHKHAYQGDAYGWGIRKAGASPQTFDPKKAIRMPEGTIPALVDRETWAAVQVALQRNKAQSIRSAKDPEAALLRGGFVRCGTCGRVMTARPRSDGGVDYRCRTSNGLPCPRPTTIMGSVIDHAVWSRVRAVIVDPDTIARQVERLRGQDPSVDDLNVVQRLITEIERQRTNLSNAIAMLDDADAAAPLVAQLRALSERRRVLGIEQDALNQKQAAWASARLDVGALASWCATVSSKVDELTWQDRRMALTALGVSATIYPPDHEPRYVIDADINLGTLSNTTSPASGWRPSSPARRRARPGCRRAPGP